LGALSCVQPPCITTAGPPFSPTVPLPTQSTLVPYTTLFRSVTVATGTNPGGGTLSGTPTVAASGGVATFSDLSINKSGNGYTLTASGHALTLHTRGTFDFPAAAATKLAYLQQPSASTGGVAV